MSERMPYSETDNITLTKLALLSERARRDPKLQFTSLAHLLNAGFLKACYYSLGRDQASGMDGVSWKEYGERLDENLNDLVARLKAKRYKPQPARRVYIPKDEHSKRPLGLPAQEDKIVQKGIAWILEAIYEQDFLDCSYGFRPKRNCHQALDVVDKTIMKRPIHYVIEADIKGYFDNVSHSWMLRCLEVRIQDPSLLLLIRRFLKAGYVDAGQLVPTEQGTPQGGNLSPIIANIFLHYVLDLWFEKKIKPQVHSARFMLVTPDFFATMGIPFLRGQTVTDQGADNVVIDRTFARQCFGDVDPVGQTLLFHGSGDWPVRVAGVVDTVKSFETPEPGRGVVYGRGREFGNRFAVVLVRTWGDPMTLAAAVRRQIAELEKDQVIELMEPLRTTLSRMLAPRRFVMLLLSVFAGIALILATVGVYGLLQYSTAQQTHDIGIRMALGARHADIVRAVVGQGFKLMLIGVAIGLLGAVLLTRVISSFLYGVTRTDPVTFACVALAFAGASLLASYLPARRAARIDPMVALRYE